MSDHRQIVQAYLEGWRQKDLARIQTHLHPNVTFKGPIAEIAGREDFTAAVQRMLGLLKVVDVRGIFEDGVRVVAIYDLVFVEPIGRARTADLLTFADGTIRSSEAFFDARPFEAAQRQRAAS
jgi:ketosteroid isomerase-like protein